MKSHYPRPIQHRVLAFLLLLLLALATLGGLIWRNLQHFDAVLSHVDYSHSVQNVAVELRHSLIEYLAESVSVAYPEVLTNTVKALTLTLAEIDALTADEVILSPATKTSMEEVRKLLSEIGSLDKKEKNVRLIEALKVMSQALDSELIERDHLLEQISKDTETELTVASMLLGMILVIAVLFFYRRILHPLNDLRQLLERLIDESYTPITTAHLDPLLLPVFNSYNEMVKHLAELEEAKRLHAQSLQYEVRLATQALLEQQTSLARAERLAAIGEVAAKLAHEIRNPLAGIQMAFNNLRREIDDQHQCERMGLIDAELKRLARLLNDMLDQSRHAPEEAKAFDLTRLINDLLTLTRYQISEDIQLCTDLPHSLLVNLPASGMRQALLNLVLNAANALEDSAGIITIKAGLEHDVLRITVLDDGPGFSEELLTQGIRPFRTERQQGTGLGLAMVQRFVKELSGTIRLDNIEPHGARVLLTLPTGVK
ncbi:MAG: ATP-binding protein [Methylococcaceae bacterium]|nr:ATP-binding protein [Methylococcaceae bacterium]MDP3902404.1 ATP-binding protein [Methylococcaceae bacterium]